MPILRGVRSSENVVQSNKLLDVTPTVFLKFPDQSPFMALMTALGSTKTIDTKPTWFNEGDRPNTDKINNAAGYTPADTDLIVDNADKFVPGDTVKIVFDSDGSYNEVIRIKAVDVDNNTITVERGTGSVAATNISDNDVLLILAPSFDEGSDTAEPISEKLIEFFNFTQIIKSTSEYTSTALNTTMRADDQNDEIWKKRRAKRDEHRRMVEAAMLWGDRGASGLLGSSANKKMGGLKFFLEEANAAGFDNQTDQAAPGNLSFAQFDTFLADKAFAFGSDEKWLLAAPRVISVLNQILFDKVRLQNRLTDFGLNVTTWDSSHGRINIVRHRLFTEGIFEFAGLIIDPNHLRMRHIGDMVTKFRTNIGEERVDKFTDEWRTEATLQVAVPDSLALITNVQNAV